MPPLPGSASPLFPSPLPPCDRSCGSVCQPPCGGGMPDGCCVTPLRQMPGDWAFAFSVGWLSAPLVCTGGSQMFGQLALHWLVFIFVLLDLCTGGKSSLPHAFLLRQLIFCFCMRIFWSSCAAWPAAPPFCQKISSLFTLLDGAFTEHWCLLASGCGTYLVWLMVFALKPHRRGQLVRGMVL